MVSLSSIVIWSLVLLLMTVALNHKLNTMIKASTMLPVVSIVI